MSLRDLIARFTATGEATAGTALPPRLEALVPEVVAMVAEEIEPNLVHLPRYRKRIEPSVRRTIAYLREMGSQMPERAVDLSARAWSSVVELNTLFATPADVTATFARSEDLRRWFGEHPAAEEAYAWIGAERHERTVLGMALVGDSVQRDVMQTTLSFDQHRIVLPANGIVSARVELGLAVFRGLLAIVLERIEASRTQSRSLAERQAMLRVRVRRLKQQRQSIDQLAGADGSLAGELTSAESELAAVGAELQTSKERFTTLDTYLEEAQRVLDLPAESVSLAAVPVRVDRMGVSVGREFAGLVNELTLLEIRVPARNFQRVAVLVRCLRADLPPAPDTQAGYAQYL